MSKPGKQVSTNTKKDGKTIVESSSNLQLGSSCTSNADRINRESYTISGSNPHSVSSSTSNADTICPETFPICGSNPHWGSSSTSNANTISRKSSTINGKSYKDACLGIDPVVRYSQTNTINSMCQVDTLFNGGQFEEALKGYEEIHRLDPTNPEVDDKISRCHLSLRILKYWEELPKKIKKLEDRLEKKLSEKTKEVEDQLDNSYMTALKEVDSFIAAGTTSRYILAIKADLLLSLNRPDQAEETISKALKLEPELQPSLSLGVVSESYVCIIHAKVELVLGRFENAVVAARQAHILDPLNDEVTTILENVHMAKLACDKGDKMFHSGNYMEASEKYMIGLNYAWPNIALLYRLATCHWRLRQWEKCIKFCNHVHKFSQNNPVDPCLFANPFAEDNEEQVALEASLSEDISDIKFKRGVEEVNSIEQYKVAISAPGPTIVFFMDPSNAECTEFSSFVESLCISFPLANFLKVDINRCPLIAKSENVQVAPAFKIYNCKKNVKFMINPERIYLKFWVQIYTV